MMKLFEFFLLLNTLLFFFTGQVFGVQGRQEQDAHRTLRQVNTTHREDVNKNIIIADISINRGRGVGGG